MADSREEVPMEYEQAEQHHAVEKEYDVFISYCSVDRRVATYIVKTLEQQNDLPLRCITQEMFQHGQTIFHNITDCMGKAKRTVLIMTKDSLDSYWVKLEAILAAEMSIKEGNLLLRIVGVSGVQDKDLKPLKRGMLEKIPHMTVDFNKENWNVPLYHYIVEDIKLPELLPVGCLAHGLVFSHYIGFLTYVLPELDKVMKETNIYKTIPSKVSTKLYIFLPSSCEIHKTMECYDRQKNIVVEKIEEKWSITKNHAGKRRDFNLTIYRVRCGNEEYYFVADMPNVLSTISTMKGKNLAEVDIPFQIARFYYTLGEVINHSENMLCQDTVRTIIYNEKYETLADAIFCAVRDDLQPSEEPVNDRTPQRLLSQELQACEYDAVIATSDCTRSNEEAHKIQQFLENSGKKVSVLLANENHFQVLSTGRWNIFVFSKEGFGHTITRQCISMLYESVDGNALRVLPVLVDVDPSELPTFIKWVTLLKSSEPRYLEKLLKTMNGGIIAMEHRMPAGDVATGLAWGYIINYLRFTLLNTDLRQRIQKFLRENEIGCGCILKMFILVPKTCTSHPDLAQVANEGYPNGNGPLTHLGTIEPTYLDAGAQFKRPFCLHMYQFVDPRTRRTFCFIAEYSTPINCLHEMANSHAFAGLLKEDMFRQAEVLVQRIEEIVNREAVKQHLGDVSHLIKSICYDDERVPLLTALQEQIKFDEVPVASQVFAEDSIPQGDPRNPLPSICNA